MNHAPSGSASIDETANSGLRIAPPRPRVGLALVLLGGPGSGKGTQAESLARDFGLPRIGTGDLFREYATRDTDLGKLAKACMERGELVPDDIVAAIVRERLGHSDTTPGFILDGFPRTQPQAIALEAMLIALNRRLAGVICIRVSDDEIVERLGGRLSCSQCHASYHIRFRKPSVVGRCDECGGTLYQRDDDNPGTVRERLKTFHVQTEPLIGYYRAKGLLIEVDGEGDIACVTDRISRLVEELRGTVVANAL